MKLAADRPFGDPEAAARKLVEPANAVDPMLDGALRARKLGECF